VIAFLLKKEDAFFRPLCGIAQGKTLMAIDPNLPDVANAPGSLPDWDHARKDREETSSERSGETADRELGSRER